MGHQPAGHQLESLGAVLEPTQHNSYRHQFRPESVEMAVIVVTEGGEEAVPEIKKRLEVDEVSGFTQPWDGLLQLWFHLPQDGRPSSEVRSFDLNSGSGIVLIHELVPVASERALCNFVKGPQHRQLNTAMLRRLCDPACQAVGRDAKPFPEVNKKALARALNALNIGWRYNIRAHKPEFKMGEDDWCPSDDRLVSYIRELIAEKFQYMTTRGPKPLNFGEDRWDRGFSALLYNYEVDPFELWLDGLPRWDGKPRINELLQRLFGAEDSELTRWCSSAPILGAVQRTYKPGAKIDQMVVMVGPQGIGKSAFCRHLLPPEHPEWFADGLELAASPKVRAESLQGRVIVEASEMAGATRADLESLKAFLTRQDDGSVRLAYRHDPEVMLRRAIFVGSTNDAAPLPNDPSGNRRFVPVLCPEGCAVEYIAEGEREQWWAEGVRRVRNGATGSLPRYLIQDAAKGAERYRNADSYLEDRVAQIQPPGDGTGLPLESIARQCGLLRKIDTLDMRLQKRLASALQIHGWTSKREQIQGIRSTRWYFNG